MTISKTKAGFASEKIQNFIVQNTEADPKKLSHDLLEFEMTFGTEGIAAMFGAICYSNSQTVGNPFPDEEQANKVRRAIVVSIMHDLNGRHDAFMLPRTNGFLEFANFPAYME